MKFNLKMFFTGNLIALIPILLFVFITSQHTANAWTQPSFPSCQDLIQSQKPGDIAHHTSGTNAIAGAGEWLEGADDVYSVGDGNATQCFCPPTGVTGIQTNWWNVTDDSKPVGWITIGDGAIWNLPGKNYFAQNSDFACKVSPTPTETPTITPTSTPSTGGTGGGSAPTFAGSSTNAPVCTNGDTTQLPANPFVVRKGTDATVNFFITQGDSANIYWSVVGQPHWGNSSAGTNPDGVKPNDLGFVSYPIHDLDASQGYDFGIQQKYGCGGGKITEVIVDGPQARTFRVSYLEYSK